MRTMVIKNLSCVKDSIALEVAALHLLGENDSESDHLFRKAKKILQVKVLVRKDNFSGRIVYKILDKE